MSLWENLTTAEDFTFMARDGREDHPSRAVVNDWIANYVATRPGTSMLDSGVLSAVTYAAVNGLAIEYTGIDVSQSVIADCKKRYPEACWCTMSVTDLAYPDDAFDIVHCRHVLEHLAYYETAVRELSRVARSQLILCFFIPPEDPEKLHRKHDYRGHVWLNRYSRSEFEQLLSRLWASVSVVDVPDQRRPNRIYFCSGKVPRV